MKSKIISLLCITTAFASTAEQQLLARMQQSAAQAQADAIRIKNQRAKREESVSDESVSRENLHQEEAIEREVLLEKAKADVLLIKKQKVEREKSVARESNPRENLHQEEAIKRAKLLAEFSEEARKIVRSDMVVAAVQEKAKTLDEEELARYNMEKQLERDTNERRLLPDVLRDNYIVKANYVNSDPKFIILTTGEGKYTKHVRVKRDLCTKYFSLLRGMLADEDANKTDIMIPIHANPGGQTPANIIHLIEWLEKFDTVSTAEQDGTLSMAAASSMDTVSPRMTPNLLHLANYLGLLSYPCETKACRVFSRKMTDYLLDPLNVKLAEDIPVALYETAINFDPAKAFFLNDFIREQGIKLVNNNLEKAFNPDYFVIDESMQGVERTQARTVVVIGKRGDSSFSPNYVPKTVETIVFYAPSIFRPVYFLRSGSFKSVVISDNMHYVYGAEMFARCPNLQEIWVKRNSETEKTLTNQPNYAGIAPLIRYIGEDVSKVHHLSIEPGDAAAL